MVSSSAVSLAQRGRRHDVRVGAVRAAGAWTRRRVAGRQPGGTGFHCGRVGAQLDHLGPLEHGEDRLGDGSSVVAEANS